MFIFLKSCPFCGKEVEVNGGLGKDDPYWIHCECGLDFETGSYDYKEFESEWNTRVKESYNSVDIAVGDKRFCVVNDYPKYIVKEGTCKKISKHNDNSTKYTFKMNNYKTYTFTETSFGKKVFEDLESAEDAAMVLNKS
jgi:hypothetical protein